MSIFAKLSSSLFYFPEISSLNSNKLEYWYFFGDTFHSLIYRHVCNRGASRTAATSKVVLFVIILIDFQPLTILSQRTPPWRLQQS